MAEYYKLAYLSNPESITYLLKNSKEGLSFIDSNMNPSKLGISIDKKGTLNYPKYFSPPKKVEGGELEKISSIVKDIAFERKLNQLKIKL